MADNYKNNNFNNNKDDIDEFFAGVSTSLPRLSKDGPSNSRQRKFFITSPSQIAATASAGTESSRSKTTKSAGPQDRGLLYIEIGERHSLQKS